MASQARWMTVGQYLNPDVVYRFNDLFNQNWRARDLGRLAEGSDQKVAYVLPVFLSKSTRTFHWISIFEEMWRWDGDSQSAGIQRDLDKPKPPQEYLQELTNRLRDLRSLARLQSEAAQTTDQWKEYLDDLPHNELRPEMTGAIEAMLEVPGPIQELQHRALLWMYSGYHQKITRNLEGVLYRYLTSLSENDLHEYVLGELVKNRPENLRFDWLLIDRKEYGEALKTYESLHSTELGADDFDSASRLLNEWVKPPDAFKDEVANALLDHLLLMPRQFGSKFAMRRNVALVPLFDEWIGGRGYGALKGVFILAFESSEIRAAWLEQRLLLLQDVFGDLSAAVTESAETLALSTPIDPPYDLLEHFLWIIRFVQDWDSAVVFEDGKFRYGFVRLDPQPGSNKWRWERSLSPADFHDLEHVNAECESVASGPGKRRYIWWTASNNRNLWTKAFIPSLGEEEQSRYGAYSVRFEFPRAARLPIDDDTNSRLREAYLRQQLEVMRRLIPDVRARRSALRNAAVSIMARNMSHNIGSHVLAAVRRDPQLAKLDKWDDAHRLSEHLQRRMDFIAELATVEGFAAADSLLMHDVMGSSGRPVDGKGVLGLNSQKLLLRHISGAQDSGAEKATGKPIVSEIWFFQEKPSQKSGVVEETNEASVSFISGILGWQALYVILENIIRNIAKHTRIEAIREQCKTADDSADTAIRLFVRILDSKSTPDFFELRIWDKYGTALDLVRNCPCTVVQYLEKALSQPQFLDADNAVATNDWGMKEMFISAAFLRGIALADIENRLPRDQPPVIKVCAMSDGGDCAPALAHGRDAALLKAPITGGAFQNIGFSLWLPKAKRVAFIIADSNVLHTLDNLRSQVSDLRSRGVEFLSLEEACSRYKKVPHRYGALLGQSDDTGFDKVRSRSPELPLDLVQIEPTNEAFWASVRGADATRLVSLVRNLVLDLRIRRVSGNYTPSLYVQRDVFGDAVRIGADLKNLEQNNIGTAVVFDSHGHGLEECLQKFTWLINDTDIRKPSEVEPAFYESFRSMSPQTGLFSALRADGRDPLDLEKELLCAGLTPVVVLDERFQRLATQPRPEQYVAAIPPTWQRFEAAFSMQQIWKKMRIYVPLATECGLEAPALDSEPGAVHKGIREYLECLERTLGRGVHVIVHQTIFEKLGRQEQRLVELLGAKASKLGWVNFVCSGRGMPWQLQGNDWSQFGYAPRFVPLSELLHCLEHMPSKVHLVRLLEVKRAPPSKLQH